ncbi:hypothetical protein TA3x_000488 [Tundrisphaera sp. TA3]
MTDTNKTKENTGNETQVTNPLPAGQVQRVDGNGDNAGTIDTNDTTKQ